MSKPTNDTVLDYIKIQLLDLEKIIIDNPDHKDGAVAAVLMNIQEVLGKHWHRR